MDLLKKFEHYLRDEGMAENTLRTYITLVGKFLKWCEDLRLDPKALSEEDIIEFRHMLRDLGASQSTINGYTYAIKKFYRLVFKRELKIKGAKPDRTLPEVLKENEIRMILRNIPSLKYRALFFLIWDCALRISEALNLTTDDIDLQQRIVRIRKGKGGKDRYVPIMSDRTVEVLEEYMKDKRKGEKLFNITPRAAQLYFKRLVSRLTGREGRYGPHLLRHSRLTYLLKHGWNVVEVQSLAGHEDITTTQKYLHIALPDLIKKAKETPDIW